MNRRKFLLNAFKIGGLAALYQLGVGVSEAGLIQQMHKSVIARKNSSGGGAGASCETTAYQFQSAHFGYQSMFRFGTSDYWATKFTVSDGGATICSIGVNLTYTGTAQTGTQTVVAGIWQDNGSGTLPGSSQQGGWSTARYVQGDLDGANGSLELFTGVNITLTNADWWVTLFSNEADDTNYNSWSYNDSGTHIAYSGDGSSWTESGTGRGGRFVLYKS